MLQCPIGLCTFSIACEVYLCSCRDGREAQERLAACFASYNCRRLQQALGYRTPEAVYCGVHTPPVCSQVVFLRAAERSTGVVAAIQNKVQGRLCDEGYLQAQIHGGGLKVLIDGLNEVSPDTRSRITRFVEEYFRGDFILTTQPMSWEPPATARVTSRPGTGRSPVAAAGYISQPVHRLAALNTRGAHSGSCCRASSSTSIWCFCNAPSCFACSLCWTGTTPDVGKAQVRRCA
jgi:hypothetical protein